MNIDRPSPMEIPALRSLWKSAFGDTDEFLDTFFSVAFSPNRCRCIMEGDRVTAAMYWFETFCNDRKIAYVYAVATDPACRNRGLCRRLMEDTKTHLRSLGFCGILLVPENEGLVRMYEKMGFLPCSRITEFTCAAGNETIPVQTVGATDYAARRRSLLPTGGVLQEGADLALLATQTELLAGDGWIASVSHDGATLRCHELLGPADLAPKLLHTLGFETGSFRVPGSDRPFSWFFSLSGQATAPAYFGHPLD